MALDEPGYTDLKSYHFKVLRKLSMNEKLEKMRKKYDVSKLLKCDYEKFIHYLLLKVAHLLDCCFGSSAIVMVILTYKADGWQEPNIGN